MFKKVCQDLFTILLPLILILTPQPIFAQDLINTTGGTVLDNVRDAIRYWWIAPLALVPLLFYLWPKEENTRKAYRRSTVYQSVRRPRRITKKTITMGKRKRI